MNLAMSWLPEGKYMIELFTDGVNAEKFATDYKREIISSETGKNLEIKMVAGGGFSASVYQ